MAAIQEGKKRIMQGMQKADERRGKTVAEAAIWEGWTSATDDTLRVSSAVPGRGLTAQRMPRKLTPPLFPLSSRTSAHSDTLTRLIIDVPELDSDIEDISIVLLSSLGIQVDAKSSPAVDDMETMGIVPKGEHTLQLQADMQILSPVLTLTSSKLLRSAALLLLRPP